MLSPTLTTFQALGDLAERLDADERCEMLRLALDEGDYLDNPLVQIVAAFADHRADACALLAALNAAPAATQRLLARLIALGCAGQAIPRRRTGDTDARAYLAAYLLTGEAVIAAHYWPLPAEIAGLREVLTEPDLTDDQRLDAALGLDPRAADWISHALAQGAHPDAEGRFYLAASARAIPDDFSLVDRTSNHVLLTRRDRVEAEIAVATLNAFPKDAQTLVAISRSWQVDQQQFRASDLPQERQDALLKVHQVRWQIAWAQLGRTSAAWRAERDFALDPWRPKIRAIA